MATVEDYQTGEICEMVKMAFKLLDASNGSLKDSEQGLGLLAAARPFEPKKLSIDDAAKLIKESNLCAIGERICRSVHHETPFSQSVFLNELAQGLVDVGKARLVEKNEAIENLRQYRKQPVIASKVNGKFAEICPSWPQKCVFWNMEKQNLKIINFQKTTQPSDKLKGLPMVKR